MGESFSTVNPGNPFKMPAAMYNKLVAMIARDGAGSGASVDGASTSRRPGEIIVKNTTGYDLDQFGIGGIDGPLYDHEDNPGGFKYEWVLKLITPTADHAGRFCIALEPIRKNAMGLAMVFGVTPVKVDMTSESHKYAKAKAGDRDKLVSAASGATEILWAESGTGEKWAIVRFPFDSGSPWIVGEYESPETTDDQNVLAIVGEYVVAVGAHTVARSAVDDCETWERIAEDEAGFFGGDSPDSIAVTSSGDIYVVVGHMIYISGDGGASWTLSIDCSPAGDAPWGSTQVIVIPHATDVTVHERRGVPYSLNNWSRVLRTSNGTTWYIMPGMGIINEIEATPENLITYQYNGYKWALNHILGVDAAGDTWYVAEYYFNDWDPNNFCRRVYKSTSSSAATLITGNDAGADPISTPQGDFYFYNGDAAFGNGMVCLLESDNANILVSEDNGSTWRAVPIVNDEGTPTTHTSAARRGVVVGNTMTFGSVLFDLVDDDDGERFVVSTGSTQVQETNPVGDPTGISLTGGAYVYSEDAQLLMYPNSRVCYHPDLGRI